VCVQRMVYVCVCVRERERERESERMCMLPKGAKVTWDHVYVCR